MDKKDLYLSGYLQKNLTVSTTKTPWGSSLCQRNTVSKEASEPATKSKSKLWQPFPPNLSSVHIFSIAFFIQQI